MARPKKDEKPEEGAAAGATTISVDEFRKTRDSVIQGLTGLQVAVSNLMSAYMTHCNNILGEGNPDGIDAGDLNRLTSAFAAGVATEALIAPVETKKEKKKRAKKERDPDMPKRPLTAAFLYGQNARPIIKKDLEEALAEGDKLGANAVNEEVTKRWNGMSEEEKQLWRNAYQENMVKYKQQMEEYAANKGTTLDEVHALAEDDTAAGAVPGVTSEDDTEKEPSPPPKAPSPPAAKGNKRRKVTKENGVTGSAAAAQSPVPLPNAAKASVVPVPTSGTPAKAEGAKGRKKKEAPQEKEASPEEPKKKRVRKSKAAEEAEVEPTPEADKRKRKRKSEA